MNTRLSFCFPKAARLCTRRDFQRIARGCSRKIGQWITMDIRQGKACRPRLGITVSRKCGKSHDRNRFKRMVREAFRHCQHQLPRDLEVNVRPRSKVEPVMTSDILQDLLQLTKLQT